MNTNGSAAVPDLSLDPILADLVAEITDRLQAGEVIEVEAYVAAHPERAEALRRLLPSLALLALAGGSGEREEAPAAEVGDRHEEPPTELGDFRILREVGRGGMGVVYEAEQVSLRRRVALKVLPFAGALDARQLQRFRNEAQAAAGLHHTNIVPVYGVGSERGIHYYAMQFIDGHTLAALIRQLQRQQAQKGTKAGEGAAPPTPIEAQPTTPHVPGESNGASPAEGGADTPPVGVLSTEGGLRGREYYRAVARLGVQAAEALDCAHQVGVVHRDVKPANLMVEASGHLWVTDFGLARIQSEASLTQTGDLVGTLRYMSPEQALAKRVPIDHRTDVYSLGATLYELLTLRPVFGGTDRQELLRQIALEEPTSPRRINRAIPAELEIIVLKALEKNPQDRYGTAQELADDLRRFLDVRPIHAKRPSLAQRAVKWARRHLAVVLSAGVVVMVALIALGISTCLLWREKEETRAALARADAKNRWARRAVNDMYEEVADRWLADEPHMTQTQRQFLRKALDYYEELAEEKSTDPTERLEMGIAYRRMGGIHDSALGQPDEANVAYERAVSIFEGLVAEYPGDATYRRELARSYQALGGYHRAHARLPEAEKDLLPARDLFTALADQSPDSPESQHDLAGIQKELAMLWEQTDRMPQARDALAQVLRIYEDLEKRSTGASGYREELANAYLDLADLLLDLRDLPGAERFYHKGLDLLEKFRQEPGPTPWSRSGLGGGPYNGLADVLLDMGRPGDAKAAIRRSLEIRLKSYADFPDIPAISHGLALTYSNQGRCLSDLGCPEEAEAAYREALEVQQKVVDRQPGLRNRRQEFAVMHLSLAWLYLLGPTRIRDPSKALPLVEKALELEPESSTSLTARGVIRYRRGELKEAEKSFQEAIKRADGPDQPLRNWVSDVSMLRRVAERDARMARVLNWFFLAMSYQRRSETTTAREYYRLAVQLWQSQPIDPERVPELTGIRDEAVALLDISGPPTPEPEKKGGGPTHWRLGDKEQARKWYNQAVEWMEKNRPQDEELRRFRDEARALLDGKEQAVPQRQEPGPRKKSDME